MRLNFWESHRHIVEYDLSAVFLNRALILTRQRNRNKLKRLASKYCTPNQETQASSKRRFLAQLLQVLFCSQVIQHTSQNLDHCQLACTKVKHADHMEDERGKGICE